MVLIKRVYTKSEFMHLMRKLELKKPDIKWAAGQTPTGWCPQDFPREILLEGIDLYCQRF